MQSCHRAHISAQSRGRLAKPLRVRRARTNGKQRAGRYLPDEDCSGLTLSEGMMFLRFPMKKTRKGARILSSRRSPVPGRLAPLPFAPWRLEAQDQVPAFPNGKDKGTRRNSVPAPFPSSCAFPMEKTRKGTLILFWRRSRSSVLPKSGENHKHSRNHKHSTSTAQAQPQAQPQAARRQTDVR